MYVYFIQNGNNRGPIKIGRSIHPEKRLKDLQTASPYKLKLLAVIYCDSNDHAKETEKKLHRLFKRHRLNGEWFRHNICLKKIHGIEFNKPKKRFDKELDDMALSHMRSIMNE